MNTRNNLLKVIILGDGGVGKSCLINRYVNNQFNDSSFRTIGVEFLNKDIDINGVTYTLQIWDTAGQERFRSLRTPFYRGSDICVLTYAVDDFISFKNLNIWLDEFVKYADIKLNSGFPFLIVGTKIDVDENCREVTLEQALSWCKEHEFSLHIETSSKNSINVEHLFNLAVDTWAQLDAKMEKPYFVDTVCLDKQNTRHRSICCNSN